MHTLNLLAKGGLGNQLFQVGAALEAAAASGQSLQLSTPAYALDRKRVCHAASLFPELPRRGPVSEWLMSPLVLDRVARARWSSRWVLSDVNAGRIGQPGARWHVVSGYFQHHRFTPRVAQRLRERLEQPGLDVDRACIAVHVRRTDFLRIPHLEAEYRHLMEAYYRPTIERAWADLGARLPLAVVSDDPAGALSDLRAVLGPLAPRLEAAGGGSIWQDLKQLAQARALVGSNSTFCWWAARVSEGATYLPAAWLERERARPGYGFDLSLPGVSVV